MKEEIILIEDLGDIVTFSRRMRLLSRVCIIGLNYLQNQRDSIFFPLKYLGSLSLVLNLRIVLLFIFF